ncbi:GIY-YIG nuclease family protein [Eleftheria terrae]|uniref:GIY-YIG nuclease family protein n=1 Tax=Eleftheria terrae TaxID=1597781 RepID=UPI00263BB305|nr:GIY-YIG nuclease family protein [Eleftheria terrae]WKB53187.1 GIY-YIG nuclease family protein [Eleftheria terrae]
MPLQMIDPFDKFVLKRSVSDRNAVIGHLRSVLNVFANKPQYHEFYIGVTSDLDQRFKQHRVRWPNMKWMCPIYSEPENYLEDNFFNLEGQALKEFEKGIVHPQTQQVLLRRVNDKGSPRPQCWLYILVG